MGNISGNLKLAHRRRRLSNGLRQSHDIGQPHYYQPWTVVPAMKNHGALLASVTDGLVNPVIGVAALHPLHLKVNVWLGGNDVRGIGRPRELLAPSAGGAGRLGPFPGGIALPPGALVPGPHEFFFHATVMNVPIHAPVASGKRYRMFLE